MRRASRHGIDVEGVGDLRAALGMKLLDGWDLGVPQPRLRLVEVPGRSGSLDLTDALGGPFFGDREQAFSFLVETRDQASARAGVLRALHGKRLRYRLTMDPGCVYEGRWAIEAVARESPDWMRVEARVTADPYKSRGVRVVVVNAVGGRLLRLPSGDMPVRPTMSCETPVRVDFEGESRWYPAGTWALRGVVLTAGDNELYVNSFGVATTRWDDLEEGGRCPTTWDEAASVRWDELAWLAESMVKRSWSDALHKTWGGSRSSTWGDLMYRPKGGGFSFRSWGALKGSFAWGDLHGQTTWGGLRLVPRGEGGDELPIDPTVRISYEWKDL